MGRQPTKQFSQRGALVQQVHHPPSASSSCGCCGTRLFLPSKTSLTPGRSGSKKNKAASDLTALARAEGFEPPANRFEACYSIQLSYTRTERSG